MEVAIDIYIILSEHFKSMNSEQRKSQVKQNKQNSDNNKDKSPSKEETKKAFNKQGRGCSITNRVKNTANHICSKYNHEFHLRK